MPNKIFLDKTGFICEVYDGDQDEPSVQDMIARTTPLITELQSAGKAVLLLVDLRRMQRMSLHARQIASKALKAWPYNKIAVFGASMYMRHVANLILLATHKSHKVRLFTDEASARKWLQK